MFRKLFAIALLGMLVMTLAAVAGQSNATVDPTKLRTVNSNRLIPNLRLPGDNPLITASPGYQVGITTYDFQTNGSSGNRIAIDPLGRVHYNWMRSSGNPDIGTRQIWYGRKNLNTPSDSVTAHNVSNATGRAGYTNLDYWYDSANSRYVGLGYWHFAATLNSTAGVDTFPFTTALFKNIDFTGDSVTYEMLWPYGCVDANNNIHVIANEANDINVTTFQTIGYWRSTDGGATWSAPLYFDTSVTISAVVAASQTGSKVAIAWNRPRNEIFGTVGPAQFDNDVYYMESTDGGVTWGPETNITNYSNVPNAPYPGAFTRRAYTDLDLIYDFNGNLHILWNAAYLGIDTTGGAWDTTLYYRTGLWHWSQATGVDSVWEHPTKEWRCDMGAWNLPICKMSLAVDDDNNLFAVFTAFNSNDGFAFDPDNPRPDYCGGAPGMPCCNGDLYICWSTNGGNTWAPAKNMTFTITPGCETDSCDSDNWSSAAEYAAADSIHILYINDKDAGGVVQTEGGITINPVNYMTFPNPVTYPPTYEAVFPYSGGWIIDSVTEGTADSFVLLINNFGDDSLFVAVDDTAAWLTYTPDSMAMGPLEEAEAWASGYMLIVFDATSLTAGTYTAELNYTTNDPTSPNVVIACTLYVTAGAPPCDYVLGDINGDGNRIGGDVTFGVRYFKGTGGVPPDSCYNDSISGNGWLYVAGDVNASCDFRGSDITRLVAFFKGNAQLEYCRFFPPPILRRSIHLLSGPAPVNTIATVPTRREVLIK